MSANGQVDRVDVVVGDLRIVAALGRAGNLSLFSAPSEAMSDRLYESDAARLYEWLFVNAPTGTYEALVRLIKKGEE